MMKKTIKYLLFFFCIFTFSCKQKNNIDVANQPTPAVNASIAGSEQNLPDNINSNVNQDVKIDAAKLKSLFRENFLVFPSNDEITNILGVSLESLSCENCSNGKLYSWNLDQFNLINVSMTDGLQYYSLEYFGKDKIKGLPDGLIFNETTAEEAKYKFTNSNAQIYQESVSVNQDISRAVTVITFEKENKFIKLNFGNEFLTKVLVSNKEIQ